MMSLGGNKNLKQFFAEFNLLDEVPENRYKTIAAQYYRQRLRAVSFDEAFFQDKPDYLEGKTIILDINLTKPIQIDADFEDRNTEIQNDTDQIVDAIWGGVKVG